jgi:hypothetical protein
MKLLLPAIFLSSAAAFVISPQGRAERSALKVISDPSKTDAPLFGKQCSAVLAFVRDGSTF